MTVLPEILDDSFVLSCPDWEDRIRNGQMPTDLSRVAQHLNRARGEKALKIFKLLRLADVPGQPRLADACGPWFLTIAKVIAGGIDETGKQRIRDTFVLVPKKNSKTSYGGLLMLAMMLVSPRPRAEYVLVGPTLDIAQRAFDQISGAVYADETLRSRLHVREHIKQIDDNKSGCKLAVKTFSLGIATGSRPAVVLLDEIHLLTHADAPRIVGQLRGGQASIPEGTVIQITTQSDTPARGYFKAELEKARNIRDGVSELPGYWPVLYEPPGILAKSLEGVSDPETWRMVNPNLDLSVDLDWLKHSFKEAVMTSEEETRRWLSQHANAEITEYAGDDDAWPGAEVWKDCGEAGLTLESLMEASKRLFIGVDGGGAEDLMSLSVIGELGNGDWRVWTQSWVWPRMLERRKGIASLFKDFETDGHLRIVPSGVDLEEVAAMVFDVLESGKLESIGMDPAGVAADLANMIAGEDPGLAKQIISVPQGFKLRPAYIALERRLRSKRLRHADQPIMKWAVSNMKVDPKTQLITKKLSGFGKIDPIVATAIAAMCALEAPAALPDDLSDWVV